MGVAPTLFNNVELLFLTLFHLFEKKSPKHREFILKAQRNSSQSLEKKSSALIQQFNKSWLMSYSPKVFSTFVIDI